MLHGTRLICAPPQEGISIHNTAVYHLLRGRSLWRRDLISCFWIFPQKARLSLSLEGEYGFSSFVNGLIISCWHWKNLINKYLYYITSASSLPLKNNGKMINPSDKMAHLLPSFQNPRRIIDHHVLASLTRPANAAGQHDNTTVNLLYWTRVISPGIASLTVSLIFCIRQKPGSSQMISRHSMNLFHLGSSTWKWTRRQSHDNLLQKVESRAGVSNPSCFILMPYF